MKKNGSLLAVIALVLLLFQRLPAQDIFVAVRSGKLDEVKALVERDRQALFEKEFDKSTPLHAAVEAGQIKIVSYLLSQGAPVNAKNEKLRTPLCYAALYGLNNEMARLLIANGADVNAMDILQTSVLVEAAKSAPQLVDVLIESGALLPPANGESMKALLMNSARNGLTKLFDRLIASGVDLSQHDRKGLSPLHEAAKGGNTEILKRMIRAGLSAKDRDLYGWTPLHFAAERGHREVIALLLENGADIDARTADGCTPHNLAHESGKDDAAAFLLSKGGDVSEPRFPAISGDYFGQKAPGKTAEQFAVGIVAARYTHHGVIAFSPDGKEAYWAVVDFGGMKQRAILESHVENGKWTPPRLAPFCLPAFADDVPVISPDGQKLFFNSWRPLQRGGRPVKENIWVIERTGDHWSEPRPLPPAVNSVQNIHHQVSVDRQGNLYFSAECAGGHGSLDLYVSRLEKGEYQKPVNLGFGFNGPDVEYTPFIAPDGSYFMFSRYDLMGWTLFISFKKLDGTWTMPRELRGIIKCPWEMDMDCPSVTRDGQYLFFSGSFEGIIDYNEKPFWVDAGFISELRKLEVRENET